MYACLAVTCHLHFWQNDRDFLRATVVTRGGTGTEIRVSTESRPWRRKFSRRSSRDSNPRPFNHESGALTTELSPPPQIINKRSFEPFTCLDCIISTGSQGRGPDHSRRWHRPTQTHRQRFFWIYQKTVTFFVGREATFIQTTVSSSWRGSLDQRERTDDKNELFTTVYNYTAFQGRVVSLWSSPSLPWGENLSW